jgi:Peptidase family M28
MKRLTTMFTAFAALTALGAACSSSGGETNTGDDDGGTPAGTTAGMPATGPSAHYNEAELTRITGAIAIEGGRYVGTSGSATARQTIIAEFQRCGIVGLDALGGGYEQPITTGDGTNVLGVIPGTDPNLAGRTIFISGHYDTHSNSGPGANDNAAAVATIIGVGCAFAENPAPKTIVIAAWDAEEPPSFGTASMGSQFFVANPVVPVEQIDTILNLDPIGTDTWEGFARHIVSGAEQSPQLRAAIDQAPVPAGLEARRMGLHMTEEQPTGHLAWSDHGAFRDAGLPVLWFVNGLNKHYHEPSDAVATLNFTNMSLQADYLYNIAKNLAESPDVPTYDAAGTDFANDATVSIEAMNAALAPGGLLEQINYSATSRSTLEADLADATAILDGMNGGATPTAAEVRRLRDGIQHIMCYSGTDYVEGICNAF